jgi:chromosome segregation ATPase
LKMKGVGGDADDQNRDVEHLQNRINNLQVMLALRDKNNAALTEKLNLELDNKEKMKKVVKMMSDNYTNLLKQTKSEGDSCQCTKNKKKRKEMEVQLKEKNQRIQELEDERRVLSKDIKECEEYITNQVDEMKKLASYIDRLTRDSEKRQEQKNLSTITNQIKEKEESEESSPIRENAVNERLEELETKVKEYETALMKREDDNKALSENLENERRSKKKVEEAFTKTMKIYEDLLEKNEDNEMLRAECAMYKAQIDEMKGLKATCEELRSKAEIVDELEKEKQRFIQEIRDCNCCMINQEDKISKLMNQIESTTVERDNREVSQTVSYFIFQFNFTE